MIRSRLSLFTVLLMGAAWSPSATAATAPGGISIIGGNGQLVCVGCAGPDIIYRQFDWLTVKVTDASNNPLSGVTVTWAIASGEGSLNAKTSTTDSNGLAQALYQDPLEYFFGEVAYVQDVVTATAGAYTATFTLTQALTPFTGGTTYQVVLPDFTRLPVPGTVISGSAGTATGSSSSLTAGVYQLSGSGGIPNISMRLLNADGTSGPSTKIPSAFCATQAGADPYSVLTNSTGYATCQPIFGGVSGSSKFSVLLGGIVQLPYSELKTDYPGLLPLGYGESGTYNITVTPAKVGAVTIVSGNQQSAAPAFKLPLPLQVKVTDINGNVLAGQVVNWAATPAAAVTFGSGAATTTDDNGLATNTVAFAGTAAGVVTITATSATNTADVATFTATAVVPVTVTGITAAAGNNQTAVVKQPFGSPIVATVTVAGGASPAGLTVTFTVTSGPATLSAPSAVTDSNGNAQVTVTAGSTTGNVVITAAISGSSVTAATFNLAVLPVGPSLNSAAFYNGADFQRGSLSPCSIASIIASGVAPTVQGIVAPDQFGPIPYTVANESVTVGGAMAPVYSVSNVNGVEQVNFQVPCTVLPGTNTIVLYIGSESAPANVDILAASPGIFQTVQPVSATSTQTATIAVLVRPDGSFVTPSNPARRGENIVAYLTGLGLTSPAVGTNALPGPGSAAIVLSNVIVGINNGGVPLNYAQLSEDLVGVYVVGFQVPSTLPQGMLVFSVGVQPVGTTGTTYYSGASQIPVQ